MYSILGENYGKNGKMWFKKDFYNIDYKSFDILSGY